MRRKGLGTGKGKGYYNIINKDKKVHSDSAKGKKQPQRYMNLFNKSKVPSKEELKKAEPKQDKFVEEIKESIKDSVKFIDDVDINYNNQYLYIGLDGNGELTSDAIRNINDKGYELLTSNGAGSYSGKYNYYFEKK